MKQSDLDLFLKNWGTLCSYKREHRLPTLDSFGPRKILNNECYSLRGAKSKVFRAESQACLRREHYRHAHYKLLLSSEILIDAYSIVK